MKVPVYTNEQLENMNTSFEVTPGVYDFIVTKAEEKTSKSGNPMMVVQLLVNVSGKEITVFDYLTLLPEDHKSHSFTVLKIKNFLETVKLPYAEDSMEERKITNKEGKVLLKLELNKEKNKNYARVDMYMTEERLKAYYQEHEKTAERFDDDIPF